MEQTSRKWVTILGSTGSIGGSTLDVIGRHPDRFRVMALTARTNVDLLFDQCERFHPRYAVVVGPGQAEVLAVRLRDSNLETEVLVGEEALIRVASLPEVDYVMAAIVGAAGLLPTLAAARSGKRVLLANKEALVMAGELFVREVRDHGAELLPIDSEHNAVFQCLPAGFRGDLNRAGVQRILLTASGGPFRTIPAESLDSVTPERACAHPNWQMGRKISVDSATLMNKGLEVIEACWLFDAPPAQVGVIIHPQSVIHSLVMYEDGSVLAQMGNPDMRTPIAHALAWPERMRSGVQALDLLDVARLDFEAPDESRFPCLRLAREALAVGGTAAAVLNAANEVAVDAFLSHKIPFTRIPAVIEQALGQATIGPAEAIDTVLAADREARSLARVAAGITAETP